MGMDLRFQQLELGSDLFLLCLHPVSLLDGPQLEEFHDYGAGHSSCYRQVTMCLRSLWRNKTESQRLLNEDLAVHSKTVMTIHQHDLPSYNEQVELHYFSLEQQLRNGPIHQWITE